MSASTAAQARSTRSSGRTGPGSRHCSGSRAASSIRTRAPSRSAGSAAGAALLPRPARLGLGMAYQTYSHVLDLSVAENLYLAAPPTCRPTYGRMEEWAADEARRVRARHPADGAGAVAVARRAAAARGRQGPARQAEGAPPRRADDGARAGGRRAAPRARVRAEPGRRRRSSTSATGCRRCSASPTGSPSFATASARGRSTAAAMSEESLVALMIGRPLQLAFPERPDQRTRPRGAPRRLGPAEATDSGRSTSTSREGEILGIAGAEGNGQVQFLRALAGVERATGRADRATAASSTRGRRSARSAPASCC